MIAISSGPTEELLGMLELVAGKLNTKKKREIARRLLEAFQDHQGKITAWDMGNLVVPNIAEDLSVSHVYVYRILGELIELGLVAKTLKGYELSPVFRKRLYRVYKALGDLSG